MQICYYDPLDDISQDLGQACALWDAIAMRERRAEGARVSWLPSVMDVKVLVLVNAALAASGEVSCH